MKLGTRFSGRASALIFGIAAVTAACGDNGVTPPDAAPDAPPAPAVLTMTPMTNSFGSVTVGNTSAAASFTLSNTGGSTTGTITPILTGTGAGEFDVQNGCTTLAPAGTCVVTVSFRPTSAGGKTASLNVSASPGGSVMANLDGSGVGVGSLTLSPGSQSFGTQTVGIAVTNNDKVFTVTNTGGTTSGALLVTAAGSDPGEFTKTADTCSGQTLAAAATCTLTIRFAPLSSGSKSASFDIVGTPGGTLRAAVSGIAVTAAAVDVTPSVQDFGTVVTGGTSNVVFTVRNNGGVTTGALANTLTGTDAASFSIANSSCTGATLAPGATCNVTVRFTGGTAGAKTATLNVTGTPGGTDTSLLSGSVVSPGSIVPNPGTLAFGPITVGQSSTAQVITINNTGGSATGALTTALGGANAADFNIVAGGNGCQGAVLAPTGSAGSSCTINVRFSPLTAGANKAGTVTVTGAPGGTAVTSLSGDGISPANLAFNPATKDFGSVTTGTDSATQTFTLTNNGGQASAAVTPALAGADSSQFVIMNTTCAGALAPAASCQVIVLFRPTTAGNKSASLTGGGATAALSGNGISPAQIIANPTNLTFAGNTLVGTSSAVQSFTVTNNGSATTGTLGVTVTGANAGDYTQTNNCTTLIANGTCQVNVTFTPTAAGARAATINVTGTPGGTVGVAVAGTGQRKLEILIPLTTPFDFGLVDINGFSACQVVTVRNNTALPISLGIAVPANVLVTGTPGLDQPGVPEDFDVNTGCGNPPGTDCFVGLNLGAGASCSMFIDASPDDAGPVSAFIRFAIGTATTGADVTQQDFTAIGDTMSLVISPCTGGNCTSSQTPSFDFMNVNVGTTATQVFSLLNQTNATTGLLETQLTNGAGGAFHVVQDNCAGNTLAVNATCTVTVLYQPTAGLSGTGTLLIRDIQSTSGSQAARDMIGTGRVPATLVMTPSSFDYTPAAAVVFTGEQSSAAGQTFAITNSGGVNSGPLAISLTGSASFVIVTGAAGDCVAGTTIVGPTAGANVVSTCNVRVKFAPTTVHANILTENATLKVSATPGGTAPTATTTNNLTGDSSSTISLISLGGAPNFGNVIIGQVADRTFRMTNSSSQSVSFISGMLTDGDFTVVSTAGLPLTACANLAPGAACDFTVRFAPTGMPGVARGPVTLTMNATNGIATLTGITGTAQSVANLVLTPTSGDFGSVLSGTGTSSRTFSLTNTGFQSATGIAVSIPNANGNYSITSAACPATLASGVSCAVTVAFAPPLANTGVLNATLTVGSTLGGSPTAALTGSGIANGQVTVNPATKDFGAAALTTQSAQQVFNLVNTSAATAATLNLTAPTGFVVDNTGVALPCTTTLLPVATCNVGVRFAPATAGNQTAKFQFTAGTYAALQGVGLSNANIMGLSDNAFGTITVGETSAPKSYIVTNSNQGFTGPITFVKSGANPAQFTITADTCSGLANGLAPGGTCSFNANFAPLAASGFGPQTATITLTSNAVGAGGVPANSGIAVPFAVSGTGANTADISIAPTTAQNDGSRPVGQVDTTATVFTITNAAGSAPTGAISFTTTAVGAAGDGNNFVFTTAGLANPCVSGSTVLTATQSCQIAVLFNPTTTGAHSITVTASENDGVSADSVQFTISGTGTAQLTGPTNPVALTANANTTLTYTNNASVTTSLIAVDGTALGTQVSIITDNCVGKTLAAGANCTIIVRYVPDGLGGATGASLVVSDTVTLSTPTYANNSAPASSVTTTFNP